MSRSTWPTVVAVLLVAAFLSIGPLSVWVTDWMWFESLSLASVFWLTTAVKIGAAALVGTVSFALLVASGRWALSQTPAGPVSLPSDLTQNPIGQALARTPASRLVTVVALLVSGILALQGASLWDSVLLLVYGGDFGWADPIMDLDASFYVFVLPLVLAVRGVLMGLVVVATMMAGGLYITRGGISVQLVEVEGQLVARGFDVQPGARRHLATLGATLLLLVALGFYLRRYTLLYEQTGLFAGPGYADVHGTLPLLTLQAVATAVAAFLAFVGIDRLQVAPLFASGVLVVVFSAVTSVYPSLLQRFSVLPNELNREGPHLIDHIRATRHSYALAAVEELSLEGRDSLVQADIVNNDATINNVRLWDHEPLLATFAQVQEIRTYYTFENVDNDRYMIDGELRQIMLSPRELLATSLPPEARTWVNIWMTYTHGYGMALGPVNQVSPEGLPELFIKDLPPKIAYPDDLHIERPEIYFGEAMETPVIVNTASPEFDFPAGDENRYTNYAGSGGVPLGPLGRYLFALRFQSTEWLFSTDVGPESRVLLHRNLEERVRRIAPYLLLDHDPYLVITEGRLVWVVDAYTHSTAFPYSKRLRGRSNYVRNSVKVTVDAYDGAVTFYLADPNDPIAQAWAHAFPDQYRPLDDITPSLRSHLRYPQDWFHIQAELFAVYHMQDHQVFYNREDEWEIPVMEGAPMAPYYTIMKLPNEESEEFILMLPFTPKSKDNLSAWMVARSDGDTYGGVRVYKFPKEKMVFGPNMISARINQDDAISEKMSLWNQQGSKVEMGTMLVIPIEESLIYVQPLYLKADTGSIPELKRVIVAYGDEIAMQPTLELALLDIFGVEEVPVQPRHPDAPREELGTDWMLLAEQATRYWDEANAAMRAGRWGAYGAAQEALGEVVDEMKRLAGLEERPPDEEAGDTEPAGSPE